MKVTTVIRKRLSQHILSGRVVTVDHLREPVTYSVLPASGGRWRVRKSWTRALGPDSQEINTIVVVKKGERDSAERFAASLAPSPQGAKLEAHVITVTSYQAPPGWFGYVLTRPDGATREVEINVRQASTDPMHLIHIIEAAKEEFAAALKEPIYD